VSLVVLLILAIVWAVFLVPQLIRSRAEKGPADSVGAFRNQLSVLKHTTPGGWHRPAHIGRPLPVATSRAQIARRRRDILTGLLVAAALTLGVALVAGIQVVLYAHLVIDVLLVTYVVMLARLRTVALERETKVRYLPGHPQLAPEPAMLLRRSGS
jgi:hypothetical protein